MRSRPNVSRINETTGTGDLHDVSILDGSGSMRSEKYAAACKGIEQNLDTIKEQGFKTFTFVEFNDLNSITTHYFMSHLDLVNLRFNGAYGYTPLYRTIGETLERLYNTVHENDKVLVKIFTDGLEMGGDRSKYTNLDLLRELIHKCEKRGFTITFIGTEGDTNAIVQLLKLDASNTLVHDNTGVGVESAFNTQAQATRYYKASYEKGEDVSRGFYSKVLNNTK